jgi:hypothetical protein
MQEYLLKSQLAHLLVLVLVLLVLLSQSQLHKMHLTMLNSLLMTFVQLT